MRFDKYKAIIKSKEAASNNQFSNSLNDALLSKNMTDFWNTWRSKCGKNKLSGVVDNHHDEKSIADRFAKVFSSTCIPNSEAKHAELCQRFSSRFAQYANSDVCTNRISREILEDCIAELKKGKAPGYDGLTAEHVMHAHPILNVLLSLLHYVCVWCCTRYFRCWYCNTTC